MLVNSLSDFIINRTYRFVLPVQTHFRFGHAVWNEIQQPKIGFIFMTSFANAQICAGCFRFDDKFRDYPYKNVWFVIVSPEKIQCMHYKRLVAGYEITAETRYHLSSVRSFHLSKDSITEYESYARQVFEGFKKP